MDRNRKIWWTGLSLGLLATGLLYFDIASGHIERSNSSVMLAIVIGACGMGLDIWARSSPGPFMPSTFKPKYLVLKSVLFWGVMAALSVFLVYLVRSDQRSWGEQLYYFLKPTALLVAYWSIILAVKLRRSRAK